MTRVNSIGVMRVLRQNNRFSLIYVLNHQQHHTILYEILYGQILRLFELTLPGSVYHFAAKSSFGPLKEENVAHADVEP